MVKTASRDMTAPPRLLLLLSLIAIIGLGGCASMEASSTPLTAPITAQSEAQSIEAHWSQITSAVALAMLVDNASPGTINAALSAETSLNAQVSVCASGGDPTCTATVKAALVSFVKGLHLSLKAQLELQAARGLFPWLTS